MRFLSKLGSPLLLGLGLLSVGCGRQAVVSADGLPLKRVVVYRNGVAYFERGGHTEGSEVRFKMKEGEVGDFLATLAVMERGGSSVRAAAFPLKMDDDNEDAKPRGLMTDDEKKGLKIVVLSLDGKAHDLEVGYVAESPVWRPSYRLVVQANGEADLQAWGIVQNLSGEDWKDVKLSLVAGAPLAFEAQLGIPVIPTRPTVTDNGEVIARRAKSRTRRNRTPRAASEARAAAQGVAQGRAPWPRTRPARRRRLPWAGSRRPGPRPRALPSRPRRRQPPSSAWSRRDRATFARSPPSRSRRARRATICRRP